MAGRKAARKPGAKPASKRAKKAKKRSAGRPEFQPTKEQRQRVEILVGGGMAIEEIASAMDIDKKTLSKHFGEQIRFGRSKKRAEVLEAMFNSAKGGNVSAQKAFIQLNSLADVDERVQNPKADEVAPPAPKKKTVGYVSKKETAQAEAMAVGGPDSPWGSDLDPTAPPPGVKAN